MNQFNTISKELENSLLYQAIMNSVQGWVERAVTKALTEYNPIKEPTHKMPEYYTRKEVADILHISFPTLHSLMNKNAIRFIKVGKKTLFPSEELDAQVASGELRKYRRTC